ncbi:ABC transporter substrate-binding protein [uncultured Schumannella sp.]|uniref:ABC transporter substrate-binding protein n=1 Tax=uncultured Schumannella sp. TaxID=1195956 RepID=UPI0025F51F55|nr:ABC transporter substrate-binding protein [uncultured Schumannella sp.]
MALAAASVALLLAGCAGAGAPRPIVVGTTADIVSLDPAATRDATTVSFLHQLYPRLLELVADTGEIELSLADSAEFTADAEYTVTLPAGLRFPNGNELTASDVVFSFERQLAIGDTSGPVTLLRGLASVAALDANTVVFTLREDDDVTFPSVLAGPAGAILDEEIFAADAITDDEVIIAGGAFAGKWQIANVDGTVYTVIGSMDDVEEPTGTVITLETELEAASLAERVESGSVDVAYGSFTTEQREALIATSGLTTRVQPTNTLRMLVFDFSTMPFGSATEEANEGAALAVRQAMSDLVDRVSLAELAPASWSADYGYVPAALRIGSLKAGTAPGEQGVLAVYGDALGGPDIDRATERLAAAGVQTPVSLVISYVADDEDPQGDAIRAELEAQLEGGELFSVRLEEVDGPLTRSTLGAERYPIVEYVWTPAGVDVDDALTRLYASDLGLPTGLDDSRTDELIAVQGTAEDAGQRNAAIAALEEQLASRIPTLPLLAGRHTIYLAPGVTLATIAELGEGWLGGLTRR